MANYCVRQPPFRKPSASLLITKVRRHCNAQTAGRLPRTLACARCTSEAYWKPHAQLHQGFRPVRKSVSGHGDTRMLPSVVATCAKDKDKGAGPRTTLPSSSYWEPWQGQQYLFTALFQGTTQPRCVQTAPIAKSLMLSPFVMR
mmetsp:Transcript_17120/g.47196  ORF Transcript_17120/g.47196 Transcript_17120/m.47196 type:complete len:144 (+) Transcript_17120:163-594(+)